MRKRLPAAALAVVAFLGVALAPASAAIVSYAIVQQDGSLVVQGRTVRLFGVYIPATDRTCRTIIRPVRCAPRAALALDTRIRGFVRCEPVAENRDGSLEAVCFVDGDSILDPDIDLGAWLIEQGWAVAAPGAPFEYTVLEKIARERGLGVWGFQADDVRRLRRLPGPLE